MRKKRFDAVLFDLGDTLLYFDSDWPEVFAEARKALLASLVASGISVGEAFISDFHERMLAYYRERDVEFIEHTTRYILLTSLAACGQRNVAPETIERALFDFHSVTQQHWIPEDDLIPTLDTLKSMGYRMGLISNAADDANTQTLIDKARIREYVEVALSSAYVGVRKPNPKIFQAALEWMNITADRAVMVGDTLGADILGAKNAGIFAIWLTRRANTPANRSHRDTIIPDETLSVLSELPELLERLEAKGI